MSWLKSLYLFLSSPLYRHLKSELTIELQTVLDRHIELQERFSGKLLDQLISINAHMEDTTRLIKKLQPEFEDKLLKELDEAEAALSDEEIAILAADSSNAQSLFVIGQEHGVSPILVARLNARYKGMSLPTIREIRARQGHNTDIEAGVK